MEELSAEELFEKEYEEVMSLNEQEQTEFETFFSRNEENYKSNVLDTIDSYCNSLDKLYYSDDKKLEDLLTKISRKING